MISKILLCTDGSSYSREAARYAAWTSLSTGASVTALYVSDLRRFEVPAVMDFGGSLGIQPYQSLVSSVQEMESEKAKLLEEFTRKTLAEEGVTEEVSFETMTGLLVDSIESFEKDFDLVVLGKRGESAEYAMDHIGSTLERVVRLSSRPCLVTNREFRPVHKVAFAFDDGASCQKLMDFLLHSDWLKPFPLHLLAVAEGEDQGDKVADRIKVAEAALQEAGYQVQTEMLGGLAEDAIADYVERLSIDLLLMGAYGHTRIRRFLIGSTTTETLRRCKIPVLCFH
ncbi:MAG: universal stress protein [Verrucomicrobiota bacterium]